jgi:hypothetical protein
MRRSLRGKEDAVSQVEEPEKNAKAEEERVEAPKSSTDRKIPAASTKKTAKNEAAEREPEPEKKKDSAKNKEASASPMKRVSRSSLRTEDKPVGVKLSHLDDFLVSPRKQSAKSVAPVEADKKKEADQQRQQNNNDDDDDDDDDYEEYNEDDEAGEDGDENDSSSCLKKLLKNNSKSSITETKKSGRGRKKRVPENINNNLKNYFETKPLSRAEVRSNSENNQKSENEAAGNVSMNDESMNTSRNNTSLNTSGSKKLRNSSIDSFFKPLTSPRVVQVPGEVKLKSVSASKNNDNDGVEQNGDKVADEHEEKSESKGEVL